MNRKRALDSAGFDRAAKRRAQRVVPMARDFIQRAYWRDNRGNSYSEPLPTDANAREIAAQHGSASRVYYMRPQQRSQRGAVSSTGSRTRIRRGDRIQFIDLRTRIESSATVIDVAERTGRISAYGYIVLTNVTDIGIVRQPMQFNAKYY